MNEILINSVIEKLNAQEITIKEMQEIVQKVAGHPDEIEIIQKEQVRLGTILKSISFPTKEMSDLSIKLTSVYDQLKKPIETKVENRHHHHFPKVIWFSIFLIICLAIAFTGWFNAAKY